MRPSPRDCDPWAATVLVFALGAGVVAAAPLPAQSGDPAADAVHTRVRSVTAPVPPTLPPATREGDPLPAGGLERFVTPTVLVEPVRLAPGGGGRLHVVLALRDHAVVEARARFALTYEQRQGALTLGDPIRPKLSSAPRAAGFAGDIVYDDTATFVVPVTVDASAERGGHPVRFTLEVDVTDARDGQSLGRRTMAFTGTVPIGNAVPAPPPVQGEAPGEPGGEGAAASLPSPPERSDAALPASGAAPTESPAEAEPIAPAAVDDRFWTGSSDGVVIGLVAAFACGLALVVHLLHDRAQARHEA